MANIVGPDQTAPDQDLHCLPCLYLWTRYSTVIFTKKNLMRKFTCFEIGDMPQQNIIHVCDCTQQRYRSYYASVQSGQSLLGT